ncbi:hypothetical protein H9P43_001890 [Blastocladiella emersonii ATCC 22665]|nr:hypothetical protein H9P43_001890 [Blastocladiella emersonii ATCC 22665]
MSHAPNPRPLDVLRRHPGENGHSDPLLLPSSAASATRVDGPHHASPVPPPLAHLSHLSVESTSTSSGSTSTSRLRLAAYAGGEALASSAPAPARASRSPQGSPPPPSHPVFAAASNKLQQPVGDPPSSSGTASGPSRSSSRQSNRASEPSLNVASHRMISSSSTSSNPTSSALGISSRRSNHSVAASATRSDRTSTSRVGTTAGSPAASGSMGRDGSNRHLSTGQRGSDPHIRYPLPIGAVRNPMDPPTISVTSLDEKSGKEETAVILAPSSAARYGAGSGPGRGGRSAAEDDVDDLEHSFGSPPEIPSAPATLGTRGGGGGAFHLSRLSQQSLEVPTERGGLSAPPSLPRPSIESSSAASATSSNASGLGTSASATAAVLPISSVRPPAPYTVPLRTDLPNRSSSFVSQEDSEPRGSSPPSTRPSQSVVASLAKPSGVPNSDRDRGAIVASLPTSPSAVSSTRARRIGAWMAWLERFWPIWDIIVLAIHLFNAITVPMTVAWACQMSTPAWITTCHLADLFLLLNVGFMASRSYLDPYGVRVTDPKQIRRNYFSIGYGRWDLVGSIPWDLAFYMFTDVTTPCSPVYHAEGESKYLSYRTESQPLPLFLWACARGTRFIAMLSAFSVYSDKNIPGTSVYMSRVIKNFLSFLWVSHLDACIFWAICYYEDSAKAWINTQSLGVDDNGDQLDMWTQYLAAYLVAQQVMFFAFRDITMGAERIYCVLEVILGALVNGSIFGNIANLIQSMQRGAALDKKLEKQNYRMDYLRKYMRQRKFPPEIQKRVRQHNEFEWIRLQGMSEEKLFGNLPNFLRQEICNHLHFDSLNAMPLFRDCADVAFKAAVVRCMTTVTVQEDFYVFRYNDDGQEMYFIRSGTVEVVAPDNRVLCQLKQGAYFGELALFESCRRSAAVRTCNMTELGVLRRADFDQVLASFPKIAEALRKAIEEKKAAEHRRREEEASAMRKAMALKSAAQDSLKRRLETSRKRSTSVRGSTRDIGKSFSNIRKMIQRTSNDSNDAAGAGVGGGSSMMEGGESATEMPPNPDASGNRSRGGTLSRVFSRQPSEPGAQSSMFFSNAVATLSRRGRDKGDPGPPFPPPEL